MWAQLLAGLVWIAGGSPTRLPQGVFIVPDPALPLSVTSVISADVLKNTWIR